MFDAVEQVAPWKELTAKPNRAGKLHGIGIAAATWLTNPMPGSVVLKLSEDGVVNVVTAATENGSGAVAMGVRQIVAAEFAISPEEVVITMPDTDSAGYDAGSSRIANYAHRRARRHERRHRDAREDLRFRRRHA